MPILRASLKILRGRISPGLSPGSTRSTSRSQVSLIIHFFLSLFVFTHSYTFTLTYPPASSFQRIYLISSRSTSLSTNFRYSFSPLQNYRSIGIFVIGEWTQSVSCPSTINLYMLKSINLIYFSWSRFTSITHQLFCFALSLLNPGILPKPYLNLILTRFPIPI